MDELEVFYTRITAAIRAVQVDKLRAARLQVRVVTADAPDLPDLPDASEPPAKTRYDRWKQAHRERAIARKRRRIERKLARRSRRAAALEARQNAAVDRRAEVVGAIDEILKIVDKEYRTFLKELIAASAQAAAPQRKQIGQ